MLQELQFSAQHLASKALHGKMKCRIVIFDCADALPNFNLCGKLLADFALKGSFWAFASFDFSAGEFPPALPVAITALGGKDLAIALGSGTDDYGGYYVYGFHIGILR